MKLVVCKNHSVGQICGVKRVVFFQKFKDTNSNKNLCMSHFIAWNLHFD